MLYAACERASTRKNNWKWVVYFLGPIFVRPASSWEMASCLGLMFFYNISKVTSTQKHLWITRSGSQIDCYYHCFKIRVQRELSGELIAVKGYSYCLLFITYHPLPTIHFVLPTIYHSANYWHYSANYWHYSVNCILIY